MERASSLPASLRSFAPTLFLLALSVLINYVDRGNLSLAAPLLKDELRISASQLGILLSAFFWTYTLMHLVSGWLVDRFDATLVIAAGFLAWTLATAATGLVQGFAMLMVMRFALGVGESVAFPACSKILAQHVPESFRGLANAIVIAGMKCGPAVGTFVAGSLMAWYGWRPVFVWIGLAGLLWLPAWMRWRPRRPVFGGTPLRIRTIDILRQGSFWGVSAGQFAANYALYLLVTWLPFYLVHERGLTMQVMARTAALLYLTDAAAAIITGFTTDFFIARGNSPTLVRKAAIATGHITAAMALVLAGIAGDQTYMALLAVAAIGCGITSSGLYAFSQALAGPQVAGRWTGLQNGLANFAGVVGPALTGFVVDWTGRFQTAFVITAVVSVLGAACWVFGVGKLEQVAWVETLQARGVAPAR
ncbi:MAG TPA: MFS transporter [Terriglobales bacterium]|nr:MFS transporter [Terriglobales bacterium]